MVKYPLWVRVARVRFPAKPFFLERKRKQYVGIVRRSISTAGKKSGTDGIKYETKDKEGIYHTT